MSERCDKMEQIFKLLDIGLDERGRALATDGQIADALDQLGPIASAVLAAVTDEIAGRWLKAIVSVRDTLIEKGAVQVVGKVQ